MTLGPYTKDFGGMSSEERESLLLDHLSTVRFLASQIHRQLPHYVELEDLISAGVVGLIDAFTKFQQDRKIEFRSYAQFRIRGSILDSLRVLDWSPSDLRRRGREVAEAIRLLAQRIGRTPLEHEIAEEMRLALSEYQVLVRDLKNLEIRGLHSGPVDDSTEAGWEEIPAVNEVSPLSYCMKNELEEKLTDDLQQLPERERCVLKLYYFEEMTMKQIGITLGIAESRVSQIHSSAVSKLRMGLSGFRSPAWSVSRASRGTKSSHRTLHGSYGQGMNPGRTSRSGGIR